MSNTGAHAHDQSGIEVLGELKPVYREFLDPEALAFIQGLVESFSPRVREILHARLQTQLSYDQERLPDFLPETKDIRDAEWRVAALPDILQDRRVEITGPPDRKLIINAMNSGANVFMADFEDASSPTWDAMMSGQINLRDAVQGDIDFLDPRGKEYRLNDNPALLMVRPRGWHLPEGHVFVQGKPIPAGLWDFGLFFFHNARSLIEQGKGPYFYLPKLQSHLEARLWNDVFIYAQKALGIPQGTIKATVLVETLPAAFQMDEILYELKEHSAGLNCGRWDYIFSYIKCFRNHPEHVLPDREQITMSTHFLASYSQLVVKTCHRRGVHAIGGMAAQLPVKNDPYSNDISVLKVKKDKEREVKNGHDGSWVSHPAFVPVCKAVFDEYMPSANQIYWQRNDVVISRDDLLRLPKGTITIEGVMKNVSAALKYIEAWLSGQGAVPLNNLMEDAATAEISRTQLWQWIHSPFAILDDDRSVTEELVMDVLAGEMERIRLLIGDLKFNAGRFKTAAELLETLVVRPELSEFLTLEAYPYLD